MNFYKHVKESENIEQKNDLIKVGDHIKDVILSTSKGGQRKKVIYAINSNASMTAQQEVFKQRANNNDYYWVLSTYLSDILGKGFKVKITDIQKDEYSISSFYIIISWD